MEHSPDINHLREVLVKVQDCLSNDDRQRLHFFLGENVPRRIRDDTSLSGTLSLIESLFEQDKINEQDCTFLINAFRVIQCHDAVQLLKGFLFSIFEFKLIFTFSVDYQIRIRSNDPSNRLLNFPSILMEETQEDKYATEDCKLNEKRLFLFNNLNFRFYSY